MRPRLVFDDADIVGESAVYDERRDALLWVDIGGKRIHRLFLTKGTHEAWPAPDLPTSIGLRVDGGAIIGLRDRVSLWDYDGEFRALAIVEPDLPDNRLNEGRVGPDGAFWVGTMQNNLDPDGAPKDMTRNSGAIDRVDPNGHVSQLTPREYGITNTMAWTNDGRFLTADTTRNEICAYDLRVGTLANPRVFRAARAWRRAFTGRSERPGSAPRPSIASMRSTRTLTVSVNSVSCLKQRGFAGALSGLILRERRRRARVRLLY